MHKQAREIYEFILCIGRKISTWLTGGTIAAALIIYEYVYGQIPTNTFYWGILLYILLATYLAWRSEHRALSIANEKIHRTAQIALEKHRKDQERRQLSVYWSIVIIDFMRSKKLANEEHPFVLSIAGDQENLRFREIWTLIRNGIKGANPIKPSPKDLDAFHLPAPSEPGIVVYGSTPFADAIAEAFSQITEVKRSSQHVNEINKYFSRYGKNNVIGIAVGPGLPWKTDKIS